MSGENTHALRNFTFLRDWGPAVIVMVTMGISVGKFTAVQEASQRLLDAHETRIDKVETGVVDLKVGQAQVVAELKNVTESIKEQRP